MNTDNFATELLKQIKADKKRWFIIAMVELFIVFAIIGIFVWYISLPTDVSDVNQDASDNGQNYNQIVGGDLYGESTSSQSSSSNSQ